MRIKVWGRCGKVSGEVWGCEKVLGEVWKRVSKCG